MAKISLQSIQKRFGSVPIVEDLSFEVNDGEFAVLVGPSGCGKSTTLRMIAGLEDITQGDLLFDGRRVNDMAPVSRGVAMVFQSYALYPHMSVFENMAFGLRERREPAAQIVQKVNDAATILQIDHLLARRPRELSGGQKQRVAMGRAIVRDPTVFLFDEPLSNLDASLRTQMRLELARLHKRLGSTMIYVTHDQVEAMTLGDRIFVLNSGRLEQEGTPREIYAKPANRFVAEFIGAPKMNILECSVTAATDGQITLRFKGGAELGLDAAAISNNAELARIRLLGARPENWKLAASDENGLEAQVVQVEDLGGDMLVHASGTFGEVIVKEPYRSGVGVNSAVRLVIDQRAVHFFDGDGQRI